MGSCYSRQGQQQPIYTLAPGSPPDSDTMPHPSKTAADLPASQKRQQTRNINEQSDVEHDRASLGTTLNSSTGDKKKRFGFKVFGFKDKSTAPVNGNNSALSTESMTSATSGDKEASKSLPSSKHSSFKRAYIPRSNTGSWKMIDDSSSVYSDNLRDKLIDRKSRSRTTTPRHSTGDVLNGNASADNTPVKILPLKAAPIAVVESVETISGESNEEGKQMQASRIANNSTGSNIGKFQSRIRAPFKKSTVVKGPTSNHGNRALTSDAGGDSVKPATCTEIPQPKLGYGAGTGNAASSGGGTFLRRGFMRRPKPVLEHYTSGKPDNVTVGNGDGTSNIINTSENNEKSLTEEAEEILSPQDESVVAKTRSDKGSIDALETRSLGSIHSDDLMLDMDIEEYEELGQPSTGVTSSHKPTRTRSRSRSGSRSRSNDKERRASGGVSEKHSDKLSMMSGRKSGEFNVPKKQSSVEPIQELANLLGNSHISGSTHRRQQRVQHATRPASFPGPKSQNSTTSEPSLPGSTILRPPRQGSVHDDEDMISIDSFTYRHLIQDVTTFKTMLLRLKRLIQEDEFQGQTWKNGFKLSSSQPTSPSEEICKFNSVASLDLGGTVNGIQDVNTVIMENGELKHQVQTLHHQVEEQERTIKLLQQQMTKYECGYSEPSGKAFCHSSTQTDKTSGFYKQGSYRSACVRRSSSSASQPTQRYNSRNEFRDRDRSSITDDVFIDNESCDLDEDLLMEEVSLGGSEYCSSAGDNFSHAGSFRATSTASSSAFPRMSRDSSLTHPDTGNFKRESSFSSQGRKSVLSESGQGRGNSLSQRENSLSQDGRESSLSHQKPVMSIDENGPVIEDPLENMLNSSHVMPEYDKLKLGSYSGNGLETSVETVKSDLKSNFTVDNNVMDIPVVEDNAEPSEVTSKAENRGTTMHISNENSLDLSTGNQDRSDTIVKTVLVTTGNDDDGGVLKSCSGISPTISITEHGKLNAENRQFSEPVFHGNSPSRSSELKSQSLDIPNYSDSKNYLSPKHIVKKRPMKNLMHSPVENMVEEDLFPTTRRKLSLTATERSGSRSPRDRQSVQDNITNQISERQIQVGNNIKTDDSRSMTKHPQLKKQDCLGPNESMEIVESNETRATVEIRPDMPSGLITDWSNPKPSRPSRLPPPRPSQLPSRAPSIKHTGEKYKEELKAHMEALLHQPSRDEKSKPTMSDKPAGKKRRQLPSLAAVQNLEQSQLRQGKSIRSQNTQDFAIPSGKIPVKSTNIKGPSGRLN